MSVDSDRMKDDLKALMMRFAIRNPAVNEKSTDEVDLSSTVDREVISVAVAIGNAFSESLPSGCDACENDLCYHLDVCNESQMGFIETRREALQISNDSFSNTIAATVTGFSEMSNLIEHHLQALNIEFSNLKTKAENRFLIENSSLCVKHLQSLGELFSGRSQVEENDMLEARINTAKDHETAISDLRESTSNEFWNKSQSLLTKAEELELHFQQMAAVFILNRERLQYNLSVLEQRNREHSALQSSLKARLNRVRTNRSRLREHMLKIDNSLLSTNEALYKEFNRQCRQYRDLVEKATQKQEVDRARYLSVWNMHLKEVRSLTGQLLNLDRIVHFEILGKPWTGVVDEEAIAAEVDAAVSETGTSTVKTSSANQNDRSKHEKYSSTKLEKIVLLIQDQFSFLIPGLKRNSFTSLQGLLTLLGVDSHESLDLLVSHFYPGQDDDDETLLISSEDVVKVLSKFIEAQEELRISNVAPVKKSKKSFVRETPEIREKKRKEELKFWDRLGRCLPEWKIGKSYPILKDKVLFLFALCKQRCDLISECEELEKYNKNLIPELSNHP